MKRAFRILIFAALLCVGLSAAQAQDLTIEPDTPFVGNCFPFGDGGVTPEDPWAPFMGFIYQNIPPFELRAGDILAFDLGEINSADVQLDIEMAVTDSNGSINPGGPFTKVVSNTQTPQNPNGDTIIGNFEMMFTAEQSFSFPGGGLIIRFSNPSAAYRLSMVCDQVLVNADSVDPSGYFVLRYFADTDGLPPYDDVDNGSIGGFRITQVEQPLVVSQIPTLSEWGMIAAAAGLGLVGFLAVRRRRTVRT